MKIVVAVLLSLFAGFAFADGRADRIEHVRQILQAELDSKGKGGKVLVEDSGKDIDVGAGDGPLVIVKLPSHGRECLVALHPTDQNLMATLGCDDVAPTRDM